LLCYAKTSLKGSCLLLLLLLPIPCMLAVVALQPDVAY
jgi:hypothetical protein